MLTVTGRFWRAVPADRIAQVLDPPGPNSAGRYHRPGEPALYLTREADWAAIALGRYLLADGVPRFAVPLDLDRAELVDQRDTSDCANLGFDPAHSQQRWQDALERGEEPPSWRASDASRASGADGLVDLSRGISGGWHVVLFDWNRTGAPSVRVAGDPVPCNYWAARDRWPAPSGWALPPHLAKG